jgi:diphosphomevalonate decarboxylase
MTRATAVAHPNIALAKYWGKRAEGDNLPSVPSVSVTLAGMSTVTEVETVAGPEDRFVLAGEPVFGRPLARIGRLCDLLWGERAGKRPAVAVASKNDFPTAAGLASSASAFAALAVAADAALGTGCTTAALSAVARRVSASSGRSLFGGFVELPAGPEHGDDPHLSAVPIAPADHWAVRVVVAVTSEGPKPVGSTEGMILTAKTSVLYDAWVASAPAVAARVRQAILDRDLDALGPAVEQSALAMHATAIAADPGLLYWNDATVRLIHAVRALRKQGLGAWLTIDAGPHVKVLCAAAESQAVAAALGAVPGVLRTIVAEPGQGARRLEGA